MLDVCLHIKNPLAKVQVCGKLEGNVCVCVCTLRTFRYPMQQRHLTRRISILVIRESANNI